MSDMYGVWINKKSGGAIAVACIAWPIEAMAQGQGSWGNGLVGSLLMVAASALILVAGLIYLITGVFISKKMPRVAIAAFVTCAPLAYCSFQTDSYGSGLDNLRANDDRLVKDAYFYLVQKCPETSKTTSPATIPPGSGLYIQANGDSPPDIANQPEPPVITKRMVQDRERYGQSFPHFTHDKQYRRPLDWTKSVHLDWQEAGFAFAEFRDPLTNLDLRRAPLRWWQANTPPGQLENSIDQKFKSNSAHLKEDSMIELPAQILQSKYRLELRDVSTREDRDNWVARGRIRLLRISDGSVLAEHLGMAANERIVFENDRSWEKIGVCPGPEQRYLESNGWNASKFIQAEMVSLRKP